LSPRDTASEYKEFISASPAGFIERQAKEAPRVLTANQLHLKRRKAYTTARPSISQGIQNKDATSFASIP